MNLRRMKRLMCLGMMVLVGMLFLPLAYSQTAPSETNPTPTNFNSFTSSTYQIGVLANRGRDQALSKWNATATYLTENIAGLEFEVVPLDFEQMYEAVENDTIDFIIANSGMYVDFEALYGANRIATLKNLRLGNPYTQFGGVILRRSDRADLETLSDLKGKTFAAVSETSLGGWQMAWRELKAAGIDPQRNFKELNFLETHDQVVFAIEDNEVDAGTVRTDTLERMAAEGKIDLDDFQVINKQSTNQDFPFLLSTRLYPEWPFATARNTPVAVAEKVTATLLQMPDDSTAAKTAKIEGWTIPLNYQPVHECFIELGIGPYQSFGRLTLGEFVQRFWYWIAGVIILLTIPIIFFQQSSLRQRKRAESAMQELNQSLEKSVNEKELALTFELEKNEQLQQALAQMSELQVSSEDVAKQVAAVDQQAQKVLQLVEQGATSVENTVRQMEALKNIANVMESKIDQLLENSRLINSITAEVSDLSEKTNLLALNAGVEAARAGESAAGFSIIATEVRRLADQSRQSTDKIRGLISDTSQTIKMTVEATTHSSQTVEEGVKIAQITSQSLQGVQEAINEVVNNARQISLSTRQQASSIQQVVTAINTVQSSQK